MQTLAALSQRRSSALTRFALRAFTALFLFVLSVAAYDFVPTFWRATSSLAGSPSALSHSPSSLR